MMKLKLAAPLLLPLGVQYSLPARSQQSFTYSSQSNPLAVDHLISCVNACDRQVHLNINAGASPLPIAEVYYYSSNEMPGGYNHPASVCFSYLINDRTAY